MPDLLTSIYIYFRVETEFVCFSTSAYLLFEQHIKLWYRGFLNIWFFFIDLTDFSLSPFVSMYLSLCLSFYLSVSLSISLSLFLSLPVSCAIFHFIPLISFFLWVSVSVSIFLSQFFSMSVVSLDAFVYLSTSLSLSLVHHSLFLSLSLSFSLTLIFSLSLSLPPRTVLYICEM